MNLESRLLEHSDQRTSKDEEGSVIKDNEGEGLQQRLDEALLKITQLETALATSVPGGPDDSFSFGEVDLGGGDAFGRSRDSDEVNKLQQTLAEKNELVASMQDEQRTLKDKLYSLQDELKLVESLRSNLAQSKETLESWRTRLEL